MDAINTSLSCDNTAAFGLNRVGRRYNPNTQRPFYDERDIVFRAQLRNSPWISTGAAEGQGRAAAWALPTPVSVGQKKPAVQRRGPEYCISLTRLELLVVSWTYLGRTGFKMANKGTIYGKLTQRWLCFVDLCVFRLFVAGTGKDILTGQYLFGV